MMIYFHLLGKIFFEPFILVYVVVDESDGELAVYLDGVFSVLTVVEPGFSPPPQSGTVWIDTHDTLDVKALYVNLQILQRIHQVG
jgi:hypothetical protein